SRRDANLDRHRSVARGGHRGGVIPGARWSADLLLCRCHTRNLVVLASPIRLPHRVHPASHSARRKRHGATPSPAFLATHPANVPLALRLVFLQWRHDVSIL